MSAAFLHIGSSCGLIVTTDPQGIAPAVLTFYDLLRAQTVVSEREG